MTRESELYASEMCSRKSEDEIRSSYCSLSLTLVLNNISFGGIGRHNVPIWHFVVIIIRKEQLSRRIIKVGKCGKKVRKPMISFAHTKFSSLSNVDVRIVFTDC